MATEERKGLKQALIDAGFPANRSCYTCHTSVGVDSHFCGNGDDAFLVQAMLDNPAAAPLITQALQIHIANQ